MLIYQVDAFTSRPFGGNPAAVVLLEKSVSGEWMQSLAQEMNLSETAFAWPEDEGYRLRWFTPVVEVDLCGHATLATAHVLWQQHQLDPLQPVQFYTRSGKLSCTKAKNWIEMDFPAKMPEQVPPPAGLAEALGCRLLYAGSNQMDYLVEVESEDEVRRLQPEFSLLARLPVRGVIVTCRSTTPGYDFISRFFAPAAGVNEDPVTGSAHTALAPYWSARLGKTAMTGYQASARGGVVKVRLTADRVVLIGQAVTVMKGEWLGGKATGAGPITR